MKKILFISSLLLFSCSTEKKQEKKENIITVSVEKVQEKTFNYKIRTSGIVAKKKQSKLSFKLGGIVGKIHVSEGETVRKGQKLAELNLTEINAKVNQAKLGLEKAKRDFARVEKLKKENIVTNEQFQNAKTALDFAKSNYDIAKYNKNHSTIYAPANGKILKQIVEQNELTSAGYPIFVFSNTESHTVIRAHITEKDIFKIEKNSIAKVTFDNGKIYNGNVSEIAAAANLKNGLFEIEITLNENFLTGMIGKIEIESSENEKTLALPIEAIFEADKSDAKVFVYDQNTQKVELRSIKIGKNISEYIPVYSGLANGEFIVNEGASFLVNGSKVILANNGE